MRLKRRALFLLSVLMLFTSLRLSAPAAGLLDDPGLASLHAAPLQGEIKTPDGTYVLCPGDEITLEDANMGKVTTGQLKIPADGAVDLPLIGEVPLAGLSVDEARALLNERYKQYYVSPALDIQVLYEHPIRVYLQGAVNAPGVYVSGKNSKHGNVDKFELGSANLHYFFYQLYLTDVLIMAGGLKPNADLRDIRVHRTYPSPQTIHVNLWQLLKSGEVVQDLALRENDIVEIPSLPKDALAADGDWKLLTRTNMGVNRYNVNVIGAVTKPGTYQLGAKDSILDAIALAGGFAGRANRKGVYVLRTNSAGQVFKKRLELGDAALTGKGKADVIALLPEDVIFVDEANGKKLMNFGFTTFDRATGAALLPFFNELLKDTGGN